jgi:hypothetical protein
VHDQDHVENKYQPERHLASPYTQANEISSLVAHEGTKVRICYGLTTGMTALQPKRRPLRSRLLINGNWPE